MSAGFYCCPLVSAFAPDLSKKRTGTFLGLPYDWRRPSLRRLRDEMFNLDEPKWFVPKSYGWGYGINLAAPIVRRRRRRSS